MARGSSAGLGFRRPRGHWEGAGRRGILRKMLSRPQSTGSTPTDQTPDRIPLLRWAGIAYTLLAAVALAWNGWAGRPWAYVDPAAAAAGVRWGRDLGLG